MSSSFCVLPEFIVSCGPSGYFTVSYLYGLLLMSLSETEMMGKNSLQNMNLWQFVKSDIAPRVC